MNEICGDGRLGPMTRVAYLLSNFARNLTGCFTSLDLRYWQPDAPSTAGSTASPGRLLSEAFITHTLPRLRPPGALRVLDIGCGSGRMAHLLATAGYRGDYTGVDIDNRFRPAANEGESAFHQRFVLGDAHYEPLDGPFDLIVSVSALEHIADDTALIRRLGGLLAPGGLQVHIVPGPGGLFAYLWHGYRQYGRRAIARRFDRKNTAVYRLGGGGSLLVHLSWITMPENLLRLHWRRRAPGLYRRAVTAGLRLDRLFPVASIMYAICVGPATREAVQ